ncbi:hypothetical protein [Teredinibacter turnerae]|uniref:hypothetical protein n=1 Tax=Teredinibacter turnerae TaxID=2426 RepID=UPI00037C503D|nr:hypothetical protein [Teredinibacter turnerae]
MREYKKLWWTLLGVLIVTFSILGYFGTEVYRVAPPLPNAFVTADGSEITGKEKILDGQSAWQSVGGMQLGSVWGHGAYQAPDWTADWLHRELTQWLELAAQAEYGQSYDQLTARQQEILQFDLKQEYRTNTYSQAEDTVMVSQRRLAAIEHTAAHYNALFGGSPELQEIREHYAMKEVTLPNDERRQRLTEFFFWTAWAAATERPDSTATYTNNWPHEPLIDNVPTAENIVWSIVSVVLLIAGVGGLVWMWSFFRKEDEHPTAPKTDPIASFNLTPSQQALGNL